VAMWRNLFAELEEMWKISQHSVNINP
jgi:hypothetical protein